MQHLMLILLFTWALGIEEVDVLWSVTPWIKSVKLELVLALRKQATGTRNLSQKKGILASVNTE